MGQFLFVEHFAGIPLLDAFCEYLLQGRVDFDWDESGVAIHYAGIAEHAQEMSRLASSRHVIPPNNAQLETKAFT